MRLLGDVILCVVVWVRVKGGSPHLAGGSEQNLPSAMLNLQSLSQRLKQAGEVFQKSVAIQQLLCFICAKQVMKD